MTIRTLRLAAVLATLATAGLAVPAALAAQQAAPTTIYLVRHAEKANDGTADPPLSAAGETRARLLAERVAAGGLDVVYTTPFRRTRATAQPVAQRTGAALHVLKLTPGADAAATRAQAERVLDGHRGQRVLVVGHSNTIPLWVEALSGRSPGPMGEHDYDDLFIVEVPGSGAPAVRVEVLGTPTPAPAQAGPGQNASSPSAGQGAGGMKSIAEPIEEIIETRGLETAIRAYQELVRFSSMSYDFSEPELEGLGRRYLAKGEPLKAGVVFEMNARLHPRSPAVFVSLGAAYRAVGSPGEARKAYRRALELDPDNAAARRGLEALGG